MKVGLVCSLSSSYRAIELNQWLLARFSCQPKFETLVHRLTWLKKTIFMIRAKFEDQKVPQPVIRVLFL